MTSDELQEATKKDLFKALEGQAATMDAAASGVGKTAGVISNLLGGLSDLDGANLASAALRMATGKDTGAPTTGNSFVERVEEKAEDTTTAPDADSELPRWYKQQLAQEKYIANKKKLEDIKARKMGGMEGEGIDDYGLSDAREAEEDLAEKVMEDSGSVEEAVNIPKKVARKAAKKAARKAAKKVARVADTPVEELKEAKAPTIEELKEAADPDMKMMFGTEATPAEPETDYTDQAVDLFKTVHNTEFDPKSKMDREKLEKMKGLLSKQGGLGEMSAEQFALQVYRNS